MSLVTRQERIEVAKIAATLTLANANVNSTKVLTPEGIRQQFVCICLYVERYINSGRTDGE